MGSHISVTFPPKTVVNSTPTVTHPVHHTPIFTHLHSFFCAFTPLLSPVPFSQFPFRPPHVIIPSCLFLSLVSLSFSYLVPFCPPINHFSQPLCSCIYISLNSYLPLLSWLVCFWCSLLLYHLSLHFLLSSPPSLPAFLTGLALTHDPCLSFGSILFISFSFSMPPSSLFVFPSAVLLCFATSRQGCWQRWVRAYLKCHWQSDKRSYGK